MKRKSRQVHESERTGRFMKRKSRQVHERERTGRLIRTKEQIGKAQK